MNIYIYIIMLLCVIGLTGMLICKRDYFGLLFSIEIVSTGVHLLLFILFVYHSDSLFMGYIIYVIAIFTVETALTLLLYVCFFKQNRKKIVR